MSLREAWLQGIVARALAITKQEVEDVLQAEENRKAVLHYLDEAPMGSAVVFFTKVLLTVQCDRPP